MAAKRTLVYPLFLLLTAVAVTQGRLSGRAHDAKVPEGVPRERKLGSKGGEARAIAFLAAVPGHEGGFAPSGTVAVTYNPDGSFLLSLDAAGLDPDCVGDDECKVAITQGTSCDAPIEGAFYAGDDPWGDVSFDASGEGFSSSAWRVDNGYALDVNLGRAVVVRRSDDWIGCGVLQTARGSVDRDAILEAEIGTYPGYEGDLSAPRGTVQIFYRVDGTFVVRHVLGGLEAGCEGCGIHIHEGTSCATHEEVLGHGWNTGVVQDLWTLAGGATYATNANGRTNSGFNLYNGYSYGENMGHAVVIHGQGGERVGCGILKGVVA